MSSKIKYGYGTVKVSNNPELFNSNWQPSEDMLEIGFRYTVFGVRSPNMRLEAGAFPCIGRFSSLRHRKPDLLDCAFSYSLLGDVLSGQYNIDYFDVSGSPGSTPRWLRPTDSSPTIQTGPNGGFSMAINSLTMRIREWNGVGENVGTAGQKYLPDTGYGRPDVSFIDVPGTQIGNIFSHPPSRVAWFNEVGQTAFSKGSIEIEGVFNPPENMLGNYGFQVYYTKSGGAGAVTGVGGSNGTVNGASPNEFVDGDAGGQFAGGDVGKYIRIRIGAVNVGTFLITGFTNSDTVDVDASAISQPFTTESGMTWEMVTGPIGEYFFRRRRYTHYDFWAATVTTAYTAMPLSSYIYHNFGEGGNGSDRFPTRVLHDRGAFWWTTNNRYNSDSGIWRWMDMGPQSLDPSFRDGDISGLTGAVDLRDMGLDSQDKMWIAGIDNIGQGFSLLRWDPHPGGDSGAMVLLSTHAMQSADNDATGLTTDDLRGIAVDTSQAYAAGDRIWVMGDLNEGGSADNKNDGGISYTDDYGTTWKRIHRLHARTGTASVSNGTKTVTGVGTAFDTEFAVGDWIRFAGSGRSYEIDTITDADTLDLVINHVGGESGASIERGGLPNTGELEHRVFMQTAAGAWTADGAATPAIDFDSNGNLYWIAAGRDRVCKWDESTGLMTSLANTAFNNGGTGISVNQMKTLVVQRIPDPHGQGDHFFHNSIWVGTFNEAYVRIDPVFDGTHTRYHWTYDDLNWPTHMAATNQAGGTTTFNTNFNVEPKTGQLFIWHSHQSGTGSGSRQGMLRQGSSRLGVIGNNGNHSVWTENDTGNRRVFGNASFDDLGMGSMFWSQGVSTLVEAGENAFVAMLVSPCWICYGWSGTAWVEQGIDQRDSNLDFIGGQSPAGPHTDRTVSVGTGLKRVHPDFADFDPVMGMRIRFTDDAPSAQVDQFIVDENSTFICFVGTGKDNTQEATWNVDSHGAPTVFRIDDEPIKDVKNQWTQDGGIDGGWVNSASSVANPPFLRGWAENHEWEYYAPPYTPNTTWTHTAGTGHARDDHFKATLRIADEGEFAADGSTGIGSDIFTSAGGHVFVPGDVGKSIFVEGVNGATPDVDNGQAVILAWISGTQVQTDKTYAATNASLRWKLRDVPAVSWVAMTHGYQRTVYSEYYNEWRLYSSEDHGQNWSLHKTIDDTNIVAENEPISNRQDDGCYADWLGTYNPLRWTSPSSDTTTSGTIFFDIRDLPENVRRRQSWKIWRNEIDNKASTYWPSCIQLLDENFNMLGRHVDSTYLLDSVDPDWFAGIPRKVGTIPYESSTGGSSVDDGDGDQFTDLISAPGESFYEATGSNNATLTVGGNIQAPASTFTIDDIGKFIRIASATNPSSACASA